MWIWNCAAAHSLWHTVLTSKPDNALHPSDCAQQVVPFVFHIYLMLSSGLLSLFYARLITCKSVYLNFDGNVSNSKVCETFSVMLLGCDIAEIPLNIFIGCMNGRLARPSVCRRWERAVVFNNQGSLFLCVCVSVCVCWGGGRGTIARCYLCDFSWMISCW